MVSGVSRVQVFGAQKYAVRVQVDPDKLAAKGIGIDEVQRAVASSNTNLPTGRLEGDKNSLTPNNPIDLAGSLKAPVLGLYGGKDTGIPVASVEKMRAALAVVKDKSEIDIYPQAEHGFNADYRPSYNKEAATQAWAKMLAWFKKRGV